MPQPMLKSLKYWLARRLLAFAGTRPVSLQRVRCIPQQHLEADPEHSGRWLSTGDDPGFLVKRGFIREFEAGWYRIHVSLRLPGRGNTGRFFMDYGDGYSQPHSFALSQVDAGYPSRIVHFSQRVWSLRFDPMETKGQFELDAIRIEEMEEEAVLGAIRAAWVKKNKGGDSAECTHAQVLAELQDRARSQGKTLSEVALKECDALFSSDRTAVGYEEWMEAVEAPSLPSADEVRRMISGFAIRPLISVVMPVYNTDPNYLKACIESVRAQSWPHWELCIADDASPKAHVRDILTDSMAKDARIKVCFRQTNGHMSEASNSALALAGGDFVALLDHDDELARHALLFVVAAINDVPDSQVLYSDEDKLSCDGERFDPHFKSDWNPDLFFSQNYVSHLGVYRRELLQRIGGFRVGMEGSQDHDLLLRCLPQIEGRQIVHVPRVLYHWRAAEGSTALSTEEKRYCTDAGVRALRDYFAQNGPDGVAVDEGLVPNTYRVAWPVPTPAPLVSLLIPTRDKKEVIETAVRSILDKTTYPTFEIVILDNGSVEPQTLEWFESVQRNEPRVRVLRYDLPFNYAAINNFGERHAHGSVLGLINNDVEVISPGWLTEMVGHVCRQNVGCVGAKLYYGDGTIQHGGVIVGIGGVAGHSHKYASSDARGYFCRLLLTQSLSAVTAACLLVRREVYREVNGLDEQNLAIAFNDIDFCFKVRQAGYRVIWTPHAELYHHESVSRGSDDTPEKAGRFQAEVQFMKKKWGEQLSRDPFYSPHLTLEREDFSIGGIVR
jgi:GT2 family glycosyltransferase